MKVEELGVEMMARTGATHKFTVTYEDLADTAGTALTQTLFDDGLAGMDVQFVGHRVIRQFDGGATSELTVAIGYDLASGTDDADGFQAATSVHADGSPVDYTPVIIGDVATDTVDGTYGTEESTVIGSLRTKLNSALKQCRIKFGEAFDIEAVWTATGANLTALTAGEVAFYFRIVDTNKV